MITEKEVNMFWEMYKDHDKKAEDLLGDVIRRKNWDDAMICILKLKEVEDLEHKIENKLIKLEDQKLAMKHLKLAKTT
jgi:hypothetical protein